MALGDIIPKRDNYRGKHAYASPPPDLHDGDWWYDTTHNVFKWRVRGETRYFPCIVTYVEQSFTIPIGGGSTNGVVTVSGLTWMWLVSVEVRSCIPATHDIYSPIVHVPTVAGNTVGITIGSHSTGTTVRLRVTGYGHLL